jgi:hypothetical protein
LNAESYILKGTPHMPEYKVTPPPFFNEKIGRRGDCFEKSDLRNNKGNI